MKKQQEKLKEQWKKLVHHAMKTAGDLERYERGYCDEGEQREKVKNLIWPEGLKQFPRMTYLSESKVRETCHDRCGCRIEYASHEKSTLNAEEFEKLREIEALLENAKSYGGKWTVETRDLHGYCVSDSCPYGADKGYLVIDWTLEDEITNKTEITLSRKYDL